MARKKKKVEDPKVAELIKNLNSLEMQKKNTEKVLEDGQKAFSKFAGTSFSKGIEKLTLDSLHSLSKLGKGGLETPSDAMKQYIDLRYEQEKTKEDLRQLDQSIWQAKMDLAQEKINQLGVSLGVDCKTDLEQLKALGEKIKADRSWLSE